jgi:DNA mismatch endonuclease (patch repair protein)
MDVHSPEQRSWNMSRIRGRDTRPELLVRRGLHGRGFRFRLHVRNLPGRPDLVLPKHRTVVLVNGCFWHGHDCPMFRLPATRSEFWLKKIEGNRARDAATAAALLSADWRQFTIWECALRGRAKIGTEAVLDACEDFVQSDSNSGQIGGNWGAVA